MIADKLKILFTPSQYLFYLQRMLTNIKLRQLSTSVIQMSVGRKKVQGENFLLPVNTDSGVNLLQEQGYLKLGKILDEATLNKILEYTYQLKCIDPYRPELGEFYYKNIPDVCQVANYKREDLVHSPEIMKLANDQSILSIAQKYLGATPTISNINLWWSMGGRKKAEHAQLFHRDVDDFKFLKLFIYLTDVGMEDGPHVYVHGSASVNKLLKIRRYEDQEIEAAFGKKSITYFCEPKGSAFLVDTYGFHKGLLPKTTNRLILQVQYSLLPIGVEKYQPQAVKYAHSFDSYANRLLVADGK